MSQGSDDDRADWAKGYGWAAEIISVSFVMALPAIGGHFLDVKFHSDPWFVFVGTAVGFVGGMVQLVRIAQGKSRRKARDDDGDATGRGQ